MANKSQSRPKIESDFNLVNEQKNGIMLKKSICTLSMISILSFVSSSVLASDNYGCEALLCFAGGKGLSECKPTVKRVLKDLSKGKGFPHCSFVKSDGSTENNAITTRMYTERSNSRICRDGVTAGKRIPFGGYTCNTIEINVSPEYASDKDHLKQFYNY